ncbi:MAG: aminoacetone oxidase family FAD-binding enzyme [Armatimonadota bacterium]
MNDWDVIIIGAGAAGLMAGITAGERSARTLVLDGQTTIGAKILVAGGGRCNVTNEFVHPSRFNGANERFVDRVLHAFSVDDTHLFFERIGVPLKLEETGKYFPAANSGKVVLRALVETLEASGASLVTGEKVLGLDKTGEGWTVRTDRHAYTGVAVVVCTGGLALPKSGSDGAGYIWATGLGHTIIPTTPALAPMLANPATHADLSGITLPVCLTLRTSERTLARCTGSFLFTHTGYSGPAALNLSRHFIRSRWDGGDSAVFARFIPDVDEGQEIPYWNDFTRRFAKKTLVNALMDVLPRRLAEMIAFQAQVEQLPVGKLSRKQSATARDLALDQKLPVVDVGSYTKAEATAGGVSADEIEPATMESRIAPGLFFAGEIVDVDGWLGGYNFQWAWSSGVAAGRAAARISLKQKALETAL